MLVFRNPFGGPVFASYKNAAIFVSVIFALSLTVVALLLRQPKSSSMLVAELQRHRTVLSSRWFVLTDALVVTVGLVLIYTNRTKPQYRRAKVVIFAMLLGNLGGLAISTIILT